MEKEENNEFFIPGYKNANTYSQVVLHSVLSGIKASNSLPAAGDTYDYYNSFKGFRKFAQKEGIHIIEIMQSLLKAQGVKSKLKGLTNEEMLDVLVDANDTLLEKVGNCLDEASGKKKKELVVTTFTPRTISTSWNRKKGSPSNLPTQYRLLTARNIQRPQLSFKDKIDNSNSCFVPVIKYKPNSIKPLAILLEKFGEEEEFSHPYEVEIDRFQPPEKHLFPCEPQPPKLLSETPLIHVDTVQGLQKLLDDLKLEKEFAVDLEHHSYRTFQGFTCLMQISTRNKDYIVDTLELRSELHVLNEVFTDPKICKVIHGADMDIQWLQRDFGIYVVNLFDTGQAARILSFAHFSLAYLLKHYCNIEANKKYQLADWRIRPLPEEMVRYAREDTHYLLHVYDQMKAELLKKGNGKPNLLASVFLQSKLICLKKYKKPIFQETSYLTLYKKSKKSFNTRQLSALKELYLWRDKLARTEDESTGFVLPNHMLLQIAEILPREQQGILACCNPVPPLVRQQLNELHKIILQARELSLNKQVDTPKVETKISPSEHHIDLDNILHCPHDVMQEEDLNLPTVLDESESTDDHTNSIPKSTKHLLKRPAARIFEECLQLPQAKRIKLDESFISPFERYRLMKVLHVPGFEPKALTSTSKKVSSLHQNATQATSCEKNTEENISNEDENASNNKEISEQQEIEVASHMQKSRKKKKKKPQPDISLKVDVNTIPLPAGNITKKETETKQCQKSFTNPFHPFDYSQAENSLLLGKKEKKSKKSFNPDKGIGSVSSHSKTRKKQKNHDKTVYLKDSPHGRTKYRWPKH